VIVRIQHARPKPRVHGVPGRDDERRRRRRFWSEYAV
jgi:hypothetical protein